MAGEYGAVRAGFGPRRMAASRRIRRSAIGPDLGHRQPRPVLDDPPDRIARSSADRERALPLSAAPQLPDRDRRDRRPAARLWRRPSRDGVLGRQSGAHCAPDRDRKPGSSAASRQLSRKSRQRRAIAFAKPSPTQLNMAPGASILYLLLTISRRHLRGGSWISSTALGFLCMTS